MAEDISDLALDVEAGSEPQVPPAPPLLRINDPDVALWLMIELRNSAGKDGRGSDAEIRVRRTMELAYHGYVLCTRLFPARPDWHTRAATDGVLRGLVAYASGLGAAEALDAVPIVSPASNKLEPASPHGTIVAMISTVAPRVRVQARSHKIYGGDVMDFTLAPQDVLICHPDVLVAAAE